MCILFSIFIRSFMSGYLGWFSFFKAVSNRAAVSMDVKYPCQMLSLGSTTYDRAVLWMLYL